MPAVLFKIDKEERRGQINFCLTFVGDQRSRQLCHIDNGASLQTVCETLGISANRDGRKEQIDCYLRNKVENFPYYPEHPQAAAVLFSIHCEEIYRFPGEEELWIRLFDGKYKSTKNVVKEKLQEICKDVGIENEGSATKEELERKLRERCILRNLQREYVYYFHFVGNSCAQTFKSLKAVQVSAVCDSLAIQKGSNMKNSKLEIKRVLDQHARDVFPLQPTLPVVRVSLCNRLFLSFLFNLIVLNDNCLSCFALGFEDVGRVEEGEEEEEEEWLYLQVLVRRQR